MHPKKSLSTTWSKDYAHWVSLTTVTSSEFLIAAERPTTRPCSPRCRLAVVTAMRRTKFWLKKAKTSFSSSDAQQTKVSQENLRLLINSSRFWSVQKLTMIAFSFQTF